MTKIISKEEADAKCVGDRTLNGYYYNVEYRSFIDDRRGRYPKSLAVLAITQKHHMTGQPVLVLEDIV